MDIKLYTHSLIKRSVDKLFAALSVRKKLSAEQLTADLK